MRAKQIRDVIYRDLLVSSHFYYLLNTYSSYFDSRVGIYAGQSLSRERALLARIEKFYSDLDYSNLVSQLSSQEKYITDDTIDDLVLYYSPIDYENKVAHSLAYRRYCAVIDTRFDDSIKHKKLNDENSILLN